MFLARITTRRRIWAALALPAVVVMAFGGNSLAAFAGKTGSVAGNYNQVRRAHLPNAVTSLTNVTPNNMHGWAFFQEDTATGTGAMVSGPATAPLGSGSGNLVVDSTGRENLQLYGVYGGTRLADLTSLLYSTYEPVGTASPLAISLNFDIDSDVTDTNNGYQGRLVYEPYQSGASVTPGVWQTWDALATGNRWWGSGSGPSRPISNLCPQSNPCSMSTILAAFPNAGIHPTATGLIFRAGLWASGFSGNVDNFTIGISGLNTTYNFDPDPVANAYGYLAPQAASGPGYEAYATQAWALPNTRLNLNMMYNSGNANNKLTVGQSYLGYNSAMLQNVDASSGTCAPTSTVTQDVVPFDNLLQNEICNGPGSCVFSVNTVPAGSIAFASGTSAANGTSGSFRVAQVGLCTTGALGNTVIQWQNDAPNQRDSFMEDELSNQVSNFALYTGYTVHVVAPQLVGHVTWQGITQPSSRNVQPITVTVKSALSEQNFSATTDASGFFTVSMGTWPDGTYNWRVKGPKSLANSGSFAFASSSVFTRVEMNQAYSNGTTDCASGCLRGGDANNDNRVNATDYNILRAAFGVGGDPRADFNNDGMENISDFGILKSNFGTGGAPPIMPGGTKHK